MQNDLNDSNQTEQEAQNASEYLEDDNAELVESDGVQDATELVAPEHSYTWTASEFIHHDKSATWYIVLVVISLALMGALVYLKQWFGIAVIAAATAAIIVYSRKQPRTLAYALDDAGISIDGRLSSYEMFRSYAVIPDENWVEIDLEPSKRLAPRLTLLADHETFEQFEPILQAYLPRHDRELDLIERLTRLLKY